MSEPFAVEVVDDGTAVVSVRGLTHGADAATLGDLLGDLATAGRGRLVVDLRGAELLNSKLLDALVQVSGALDPRRGEGLAVVTETRYVVHMLQIDQSGGLILLETSRAGALEALDGLA